MGTMRRLAVLGAVLFLVGCGDGAATDEVDAGTGGSIGSGGAQAGGSGGGGSVGIDAGTGGGAGGAGGASGGGGTGGAQPGTGGTGGAAAPVCPGTVRDYGTCEDIVQQRSKKKNGLACKINCSTLAGGTNNVGPPVGPECVFPQAIPNSVCVRSCSECS